MTSKEMTGVFLSVHGAGAKYALRYKIGPFQECYDVHRPWDKIDIVRELIRILDTDSENFLDLFCAVDQKHFKKSSHRTRHYISKELSQLYPDKDEKFCRNHSFQYKGYWIGTNIGAKEITQYVREMCEASNLSYGTWSDLRL